MGIRVCAGLGQICPALGGIGFIYRGRGRWLEKGVGGEILLHNIPKQFWRPWVVHKHISWHKCNVERRCVQQCTVSTVHARSHGWNSPKSLPSGCHHHFLRDQHVCTAVASMFFFFFFYFFLCIFPLFLAAQDSSITDTVGRSVPWSQLTIRQ